MGSASALVMGTLDTESQAVVAKLANVGEIVLGAEKDPGIGAYITDSPSARFSMACHNSSVINGIKG